VATAAAMGSGPTHINAIHGQFSPFTMSLDVAEC
jgi:hypothetical protein